MKSTIIECPVTKAMNIIGGKWKIPIIFNLAEQTYRFGELKRKLPGITQQMLSKQLKELEDHNMVSRKVYAEVPPKVEYTLTKTGTSAIPMIHAIASWSIKELGTSEQHCL